MLAYITSHRTQITLEDAQYERLVAESGRTGLGLAELVRRALDSTYGAAGERAHRSALDLSSGSWGQIEVDGAQYVENARRGLGAKLGTQ